MVQGRTDMTSTTVGDMKRLYHQLHLHGGLAQVMKSRTQNVHDVLCWYYIKRKCRGLGWAVVSIV